MSSSHRPAPVDMDPAALGRLVVAVMNARATIQPGGFWQIKGKWQMGTPAKSDFQYNAQGSSSDVEVWPFPSR